MAHLSLALSLSRSLVSSDSGTPVASHVRRTRPEVRCSAFVVRPAPRSSLSTSFCSCSSSGTMTLRRPRSLLASRPFCSGHQCAATTLQHYNTGISNGTNVDGVPHFTRAYVYVPAIPHCRRPRQLASARTPRKYVLCTYDRTNVERRAHRSSLTVSETRNPEPKNPRTSKPRNH